MRDLDYDKTISEIQRWIQDYVKNANADGIVVGLSGGIDSAVTATLSVEAIGKDAVIGLRLPCLSIPQDLNDAKLVANFLGIKFITLDLSSVFEEYLNIASNQLKSTKIAEANLKARLRMISYYFVGQSLGKFLVGGTGNRTELAIGYFTKYGDGGVDIEPIGALYKCEVRTIARRLNIPKKIIDKPPSAGLWEGQTDEGEIGMKYDLLDEIIYRLDYDLELNGLNTIDVERVREMMRVSQHKLKMPPTYKVK
ncbi:MAG: NAD+ synthase [Candidatus Bathyarchaeota archaeon]|nr:NAD+ synthase [Candidatus Bathyarchaeota archaeon]